MGNEVVRHWMLKAGADQTACGEDASDLQTVSMLVEYVTCPSCKLVFTGYMFGRADERSRAEWHDTRAISAPTGVVDLCPPHSPSGKLWHEWFDRVGEYATVDVINATAKLVVAEREIAATAPQDRALTVEDEVISRGAARIAIDSLKIVIGSHNLPGYEERCARNEGIEKALCAVENLPELSVVDDGWRDVERPKIICLCGSTRFVETWIDEYQRLSDEGNIVLTVARMPPRPTLQHDQPELKVQLDELHKRKIDLADEVFVLNVNGYIGESTRSEIEYAVAHNKPVNYLQPLPPLPIQEKSK